MALEITEVFVSVAPGRQICERLAIVPLTKP